MVVGKNTNIAMEKILFKIKFSIILFFFTACTSSYSPQDIELNDTIVIEKKTKTPINGYIRSYYANGMLKSVKEYKNGIKNGYFLRFYPNGQMSLKMKYIDDKPENGYIQYFENGIIKAKRVDSAEYQNIYRYYKNGKLYMRQTLKKLLLDGWSVQYTKEGGILAKTFYKDDKKNGPFLMLFKNGQKQIEAVFVNDSIDGPLKTWSEKGVLLSEEYYIHGKHTGVWKYYYPSGKLQSQITFKKNGTVKEKIDYTEDGKIIDKFSTE